MTEHSAYLRDLTTGSEWDKPSNGTCEKLTAAAAHIDAQDAKIKALVEALEPFSIIAGEMFARNWNTDQPPVIALDNPEGGNRVTVSDFFQARAALAAAKETTA